MSAALKFKESRVPRQEGEQARLKVIKGPDSGAVFVVQGAHATIGRGEENDIVIMDLKASRKHAELILTATGWTVQDLGSANGITYNGKVTRSAVLKTKDTLAVGETLFEFMTQEAATLMLLASPASEQQILSEQAGLAAQKARIQAMSQFGGLARNKPLPKPEAPTQVDRRTDAPQAVSKFPFNLPKGGDSKRTVLILAALGAAYFLIDGSAPTGTSKQTKKKSEEERDLSKFLPSADSVQVEKTAETFFKAGFREYRVGNYLRARTQFETVLQMSPTHSLAKIYLENSNQRIEEEVRHHLELGRKSLGAGKLKMSKGHFEAVMRLLFREQNNPAYNEAKDQLEKVIKEMEGTS